MKELEINEENLNFFLKNIRACDKEELELFLKNDTSNKFIEICINNKKTYLIADNNKIPIAIGGASDYSYKNEICGQVWLLCTNNLRKNKLVLYKYIKEKLNYLEKEYKFLFNYIYKSNFSSLKLLKKLGFKIIDIKNKDFKFFYKEIGVNKFDIRHFTCE